MLSEIKKNDVKTILIYHNHNTVFLKGGGGYLKVTIISCLGDMLLIKNLK